MRRKARRATADAPPVAAQTVMHEYPDAEFHHFRHRAPYSMRSAMKYVFVLSLLLWWLPTFGQMIAGYVGGRRAGGPWRGVVAAIAPVALIMFLGWGQTHGFLAPWIAGLTTIPSAVGNGLASVFPPAAPYIAFVLEYLAAFVASLSATLAMGANGYLVTVVFAYLGGVLADQARREAGDARGTSVGITIAQPFFGAFRRPSTEWEDDHPEHFDELEKIPVHAAKAHEAPARVGKPPERPHKVDAHRADAGPEEGARPAGAPEPNAKPPREWSAHDKEAATRRFVERALRQYEAAHRR